MLILWFFAAEIPQQRSCRRQKRVDFYSWKIDMLRGFVGY